MDAHFANTTITDITWVRRPNTGTNGRLSKAAILTYVAVAEQVVTYLEFGDKPILAPIQRTLLAAVYQVLAEAGNYRARLATSTEDPPFTTVEEASLLRTFDLPLDANNPLTRVSPDVELSCSALLRIGSSSSFVSTHIVSQTATKQRWRDMSDTCHAGSPCLHYEGQARDVSLGFESGSRRPAHLRRREGLGDVGWLASVQGRLVLIPLGSNAH